MRREFLAKGAPERRAAGAIGVLFVGGVVALLLAAEWGDEGGLVMAGLDVVVGLVTLAILGWPSFHRVFGTPHAMQGPSARFGIGLAGGIVGYAMAAGFLWVVLAVAGLTGEETYPDVPWWTIVILAPLIEEWMFRGVAWEALRRIGPQRTVLFGSALLFAMMHGLGGGGWLEFPHRFAGGLVLGIVRIKTGVLWPCVLAHFVWNGLAVLLVD